MAVTRRSLLKLISGSTFIFSASGESLAASMPTGQSALRFPQGVASADPRPDSVMLWTRAEPLTATDKVTLIVQVSADPDFKINVIDALLETSAASDYTVRAFITDLAPDRVYYYRFIGAAHSVSRLGRTRTAPSEDLDKETRLAFVSCQSYEQAYYGAWARMLADDKAAAEEEKIQFVLHLGDFIYERSWNTREDGSGQSRRVPDFPDGVISEHNRHAVSLADYRHLYKTYLQDPYLQEARARWPFISTWDDHEFSNNNFQSYTTYGNTISQQAQRKLDANQAWFEFIPTVLSDFSPHPAHDFRSVKLAGDELKDNITSSESLCIYRSLHWGKHLDIVLTDTRSYRTAPCIPKRFAEDLGLPLNTVGLVEIADYGKYYNQGRPPQQLPFGSGETENPWAEREPGTALGREQRDWFLGTLQDSSATWKLWGNALPLLPMRMDLSAIPLSGYEDGVINIDAWSGYPYEVSRLMSHLREQEITGVVSLSGDHHLHGAGTINSGANEPDEPPVAVDFACAGISSTPFFESIVANAKHQGPDFASLVYKKQGSELIPVWNMTMQQGVLASMAYAKTGFERLARWLGPNRANTGLNFLDCNGNGYGLAHFSADEMQVQLVTMEDLRAPFDTAPEIRYKATFHLACWAADAHPVLEGPHFEGRAPFPFDAEAV